MLRLSIQGTRIAHGRDHLACCAQVLGTHVLLSRCAYVFRTRVSERLLVAVQLLLRINVMRHVCLSVT